MSARTCFLIPHYQDIAGLRRSLASFADVDADVLVVDDGSRPSLQMGDCVDAFSGGGALHIESLSPNQGIEAALNRGLEALQSEYEYIARLDCGDRNRPYRIARQQDFLDSHPEVDLLGGAAQVVDMEGKPLFVLRMPSDHHAIVRSMYAGNAFIHPTVVMRSAALPRVGNYPTSYPAAEDYAFFWRFLHVGQAANLPDILIDYELSPSGVSLSRRRTQLTSRLAVQRENADGSIRAATGRMRTRLMLVAPYGAVERAKRAFLPRV